MLRHWFFVGIAFYRLFWGFSLAFWQLRTYLSFKLELPGGARLLPAEASRIRHYCLGTTYLSVLFCCLRGSSRTRHEQQLFFELSALAAFFDDLVEEKRSMARHQLVRESPLEFAALADDRRLALHFYENVLQLLPEGNQVVFQQYLQRLYAVELAGQAHDEGADFSDIEKVTAEKGGCAVLLFRCLMQPLPEDLETKAWLEFGKLIQLSDDVFDLWFDLQKNVATVATILALDDRSQELEGLFERQLRQTRTAFAVLPHAARQIRCTLAGIHALSSITRCCLQRYKELEKKRGKLPLENRQMMVVDMARLSNQWLALRFSLFSR